MGNKEMILRHALNCDAYAKMDESGETRKNRIKNQYSGGDIRVAPTRKKTKKNQGMSFETV